MNNEHARASHVDSELGSIVGKMLLECHFWLAFFMLGSIVPKVVHYYRMLQTGFEWPFSLFEKHHLVVFYWPLSPPHCCQVFFIPVHYFQFFKTCIYLWKRINSTETIQSSELHNGNYSLFYISTKIQTKTERKEGMGIVAQASSLEYL